MNKKEMDDNLLRITKETLEPGLIEKEKALEKIKNLSIMSNVYRYGPPPNNPEQVHKQPHPLNKKKTVRFINQNNKMYFNMGDWLKPYKSKLFEKMIKMTVKPPANIRLDQLWMWIDAWQTIENAVKKHKNPIEVIEIWESGRLF